MKSKLYCIDYSIYYRGGNGNKRLAIAEKLTEFFYTEKEMLIRLADLKGDDNVSDIVLSIGHLTREKYEL